MYFKQFYLGCLAHASYLIGSEGEAIIVDPQRDVEQYLAAAQEEGLRIKYVIETHLHADFVSGHRELALRTNAEIVVSRRAMATYKHIPVSDKDELKVGSLRITVIETPGHTPESISLVVADAAQPDQPLKVLTGDTLFVGDVGRPDLVGADGYTAEQMASMLYNSLHTKLLPLADETEVYPAHGAGSLCGRNISKDTHSTIGRERRTNYALRDMPPSEFVAMMTSNLPEIPRYFPLDRRINRSGACALDELPAPPALSPAEVARLRQEDDDGCVLLDVRDAAAYALQHVPGSINIGLEGQFATWAGSLVANDKEIVIVAESEARVREAVTRLARVGLETVKGYLAGGVEAWAQAGFETRSINQITVHELHKHLEERAVQVLDVRRPGEYEQGRVPGAINISLARLETDDLTILNTNKPVYVICAGGYRSSSAASILERRGATPHLVNVTGGTGAWVQAGYKTESEVG